MEYGVPHQILNHSDACILIELSIHREKLETLCASLLEEEHILTRYFKGALYGVASHPLVIFQTGGTQAVQYYLLAMLCEYQARLPHHSVMLEALLNALMVILITGCKSQEYHSAEAGPILDAIWSSLQEPDREVTLASIAQEFGYSPRQVNRILQNTYGRTFSGLLRKLRMEQAAKLPCGRATSPISQIAAEVHCADASHLNKSFRQEYQLSPDSTGSRIPRDCKRRETSVKLLPENKPFVDYAETGLHDAIQQRLFRFSQEELDCREYYRMEADLDVCEEPERQRRIQNLHRVMAQNFGQQTEEPYVMTESGLSGKHSVAVLKRSRYFPAVEYRYNHFEFFYVFSGTCTHVCKGQSYTLQQGDFCLLEYGVPHRLYNHSDSCIVLEVIMRKELLDRICSAILRENTVLSHFFSKRTVRPQQLPHDRIPYWLKPGGAELHLRNVLSIPHGRSV